MNASISSTRQTLLTSAENLLRKRGYQSFSFQDLADASGIRKASVHHYFKTKEHLAQTIISDYKTRLLLWIDQQNAQSLDPRKKLRNYFSVFSRLSMQGDCICPAGALLVDWHQFSPEVQDDLKQFIAVHQNWIRHIIKEGIAQKISLIDEGEIDIHTLHIGSSIQGALQIARTIKEPLKFLKLHFEKLEQITFKKETL